MILHARVFEFDCLISNGQYFRFFSLFIAIVEIYLSPVETHCSNIDYFPSSDDEKFTMPNDDATTRLHLARSSVALFILR